MLPLDFHSVTDHAEYPGVLRLMFDPNNPVTDHAEYPGVLRLMFDPNNPLSKHPLASAVIGHYRLL